MNAVAAVFVLRDDGAALLQHRDDKPGLRDAGKWVPPGGHQDTGETLEDTARRELREETAYTPSVLLRLTTVLDDRPSHSPSYELTIFWTRYDGIQPVRCLEGQALEFIRREDAGRYDIPDFLLHAWDAALAQQSQIR